MNKILFLIEVSCRGGAQNVLLTILKGLDRKKYVPIVVLMERGWLEDILRANGYEVVVLRVSNKGSDWWFLFELIRLIICRRVNLIHAHLFDSGVYACLAGVLCRAHVIVTLHGQVDWRKSGPLFKDVIKRWIINLGASKITYVSSELRKFYEAIGLCQANSCVVYNGIDIDLYSPKQSINHRSSLGFLSDDILIGVIGHIKPWKGYEYLLDAARRVIREYPSARFLIVGEYNESDPYYAALDDRVRTNHLQGHVRFLGYRSDVRDILSVLDIFVLPSNCEGFSIAVIEAMAMKVPVIATMCGGPEGIITHEVNGFLVPVKDSESLSKMITKVYEMRTRGDLGEILERGRLTIEHKFTLSRQLSSYYGLYETLLRLD